MEYTRALFCLFVSCLICEVVFTASILSNQLKANAKPKGFGTAKRAIIIGVDGLGGAHLRNATKNFTTLRSFFEQGSYTTQARGIFPTKSGPNWSSYLTGLSIMGHGVFTNSWTVRNGNPDNDTEYSIPPVTGRGRPLTIFTQVKKKDPNLKTAMMFTWKWLVYYAINNKDIDAWHWGGTGVTCYANDNVQECYRRKDLNSVTRAKENLINNDPVLTFIHLDNLDAAGHATCWGCSGYYKALGSIDKNIQILIDALNQTHDSTGERMLDGTLIVIVSDHGGWRDTHTFEKPFIGLIDIPVLIRGPGVLKNNSLEATYVSNLDVAVTVLNAIAVEKSEFMRGKVLEQIYK